MKKFLKYICVIAKTALVGAITVFTGCAILVGLYKFADKYISGNIVACIMFGLCLLLIVLFIFSVGKTVIDKVNKHNEK